MSDVLLTHDLSNSHTISKRTDGTDVFKLGVVEVDVIDEDETIAGHETTVELGDAARHQTPDNDHRLVRVDRVLTTHVHVIQLGQTQTDRHEYIIVLGASQTDTYENIMIVLHAKLTDVYEHINR